MKSMYLSCKVLMIKGINMLICIIIEDCSKLLLLIHKYRSQEISYIFNSLQRDLLVCDYNIVFTSYFMKYWRPGIGTNPCTENCHKIIVLIEEPTTMYFLITYTKILYQWWKLLLIKDKKFSSRWWLELSGSYCWWYAYIEATRFGIYFFPVQLDLQLCSDNIVCTYFLMKYWSPRMGNIPCTENH